MQMKGKEYTRRRRRELMKRVDRRKDKTEWNEIEKKGREGEAE